MDFEVFLKLLPFTHSEHGSVIFFKHLDMADYIISIVICILIILATKWWISLWKSKKEDQNKIEYLHKILVKYDGTLHDQHESFLDDLKNYDEKGTKNELWLLWNEFEESLIRSKNHFTGENAYYNSIDAEYFFNKRNLLTHIGSKKYATVPSILLGIGLIGTFLGLFVGLVNLNLDSNDTKGMQDSMQMLIHAAGVKFASSIWGLLLSLIFTFIDKTWEKELEDKIEDIQHIIDFAFERKTAEQSLDAIYENGNEQREALNDLRSTLNTTIIESQAKSDGMISEKLDRLVSVLDNFASKTGEANNSALEQTIASFMEGMKQAGAEQGQALAEVMSQSTAKLGDLVQVIENTAQLQEERNQQLRKDIEDIKNSQQAMLEKIGEALSKGVNDAAESLTQAGLSLANSQSDVLQKLSNTSEILASSPKELERIFSEIQIKAIDIERSIQNMTDALKNAPTHIQQFSGSAEKLNQFGDKIELVGNGFVKFNDSMDKYRHSIEASTNALKESASQAQTTSQQSLQTYQNIANQYSSILDKNQQSIEAFSQSVKTYLDDYHRNTQKGVQDTFNMFNSELVRFANAMSESVAQLNDGIEQLSEKVRK